jgi:hypothetical protein
VNFLTKTLPKVAAEMALSVLAYNLTRVMNIVGTKPVDGCDDRLRPSRSRPLTNFHGKVFLHGQDPQQTSAHSLAPAAGQISETRTLY